MLVEGVNAQWEVCWLIGHKIHFGGRVSRFGIRLRAERKRLGLNQTEFGAAGGVSKDAQLNYENESRNPDSTYLMAIAAAGVDIAYVLTGIRSMPPALTPEEQALLDNYQHADEDGKDAARRVLSSLAKQKAA